MNWSMLVILPIAFFGVMMYLPVGEWREALWQRLGPIGQGVFITCCGLPGLAVFFRDTPLLSEPQDFLSLFFTAGMLILGPVLLGYGIWRRHHPAPPPLTHAEMLRREAAKSVAQGKKRSAIKKWL